MKYFPTTRKTEAPSKTPPGDGAERAKPPLRRRLLRLAVFVAVQVLIVLVLLEVVGRLFDPLGVSYYSETARYLDTMIREEPIGYRNRPGLVGRYWGSTVRINAMGLRDRPVPAKPEPNEFRILVLGDSFPFGLGVEYEHSVPYLLEQMVNERHGGARRYRTINMGVPSYNTEQELIQLKSIGMQLQPNLVVLMIAKNDIEPKMWVFEKRAPLWASLGQRCYCAAMLTMLVRKARSRSGFRMNFIAEGNYRDDHPRWKKMDESLSEMNRLCQSAGIRLMVLHRQETDSAPVKMLQEVARREGFPLLQVRPFEDPRWKDEDPRVYRNSIVDAHPNEAGSRIWATVTYEKLAQQGAFD